MSAAPAVLVLDDGELDDVRAILDEIGQGYTHLRGGAVDGLALSAPEELLVTTGRRAALVSAPAPQLPDEDGPVRIVVVEEDSNTLRAMLRERGFHYMVRRPVHPAALRLLIVRALYKGPERRLSVRIPIGTPVSFRSGLRSRPATLVELSLRGCRLFCERPAAPDARVSVRLPRSFTGGGVLSLPGWVVRCDETEEATPGGQHALAVAFEVLDRGAERRLQKLLCDKAEGPEVLAAAEAARLRARPQPRAADDRRLGLRRPFARHVLALSEQADRVLVGRNLSRGGMLVGPSDDLELGNEVRVAIFGRPREDPLVVRARVVRDDADRGVALRFLDVSPRDARHLESLVASLPAVERLADGEAQAMGTVVAEIVRDPAAAGAAD